MNRNCLNSEWKRLYKIKLSALFFTPTIGIIRVVKSKKEGGIYSTQKRNDTHMFSGKRGRKGYSEDVVVDDNIQMNI